MDMFEILVLLLGGVAATNPSQCTRNVVYQVATLQQVSTKSL